MTRIRLLALAALVVSVLVTSWGIWGIESLDFTDGKSPLYETLPMTAILLGPLCIGASLFVLFLSLFALRPSDDGSFIINANSLCGRFMRWMLAWDGEEGSDDQHTICRIFWTALFFIAIFCIGVTILGTFGILAAILWMEGEFMAMLLIAVGAPVAAVGGIGLMRLIFLVFSCTKNEGLKMALCFILAASFATLTYLFTHDINLTLWSFARGFAALVGVVIGFGVLSAICMWVCYVVWNLIERAFTDTQFAYLYKTYLCPRIVLTPDNMS